MRKVCSNCNRKRLLKFFQKDKRYRLGVHCWCKTCTTEYSRRSECKKAGAARWAQYVADPRNREHERRRSLRRYHQNPRHVKDLILQRLHGISLRKFERTKKCILCRRKVRRLVADHNHKTNKYRGALCVTCNLFLGWLEKFPAMLRRIRPYLRRG